MGAVKAFLHLWCIFNYFEALKISELREFVGAFIENCRLWGTVYDIAIILA